MIKVLNVKCPTCEKKFNYSMSEFRPFCSERCKMIDLGHWFDGSYSIASKEHLDDDDVEKVIKHHGETDEND